MFRYLIPTIVCFLIASSATLADDFVISTAVTTTNGGNTVGGGDTLTVTSTGSVSTTDLGAVLGTGNAISLRNDGTITALVTDRQIAAHGMAIVGNNGALLNTGTLDVGFHPLATNRRRPVSREMIITGDHGSIINTGEIASRHASLTSIEYIGGYGSILNSGAILHGSIRYTGNYGSIISTGIFQPNGSGIGMFYVGDFGLIENRSLGSCRTDNMCGRIRYVGSDGKVGNYVRSRDIYYSGDRGEISNYWINDGSSLLNNMQYTGDFGTATNNGGVISVSGNRHGIFYSGISGTVTNNGSIAVTGNSRGIHYHSDSGTVVNNGTVVSAAGSHYGIGISIYGQSGSLINRGSVTTSGTYGYGLLHDLGTLGTITNSGKVTTSGTEAHGLFYDGASGTTNNSGTVIATGTDANGISTMGDGNTVTNSGRVESTLGMSVKMDGDNATLNVRPRSHLIGDVQFTNPSTATLNFARGVNAVVKLDSVTSVPNTITAHRNAFRIVGDTIYVVDTNGFAARSGGVGALTGFVATRVNARQQFSAGSVNRAAGPGTTRASSKGTTPSRDWVETFGGARIGASTGDYSSLTGGFVLGRDTAPGSGYYAGIGTGNATSVSASFTSRSSSVFTGGYFQTSMFGMAADVSLTAGIAASNGARTFGVQTASSSYNNYFFSPAITFTGNRSVGAGNLVFSLGARYTALYQDGYTETGSTANLTVSGITTHILELRAIATAEGRAREFAKGTLFPSAYAGIEGQHYLGGAVSTAVAGSTIAFSSTGDSDAARIFAGLNAVFIRSDTSEIRGGLEVGINTQSVATISANVRWNITF